MKHLPMSQKNVRPDPASRKPARRDPAFDVWLKRGLHQMYDDVAREPVPEELLKLVGEIREGEEKPGT